jgi:predicted Rossmann fold nucleotide-binding protein DprA/Smf involved in DNA uptake
LQLSEAIKGTSRTQASAGKMSEILLITGSRQTTEHLNELARAAVERAKLLAWSVIVGDAEGVDACVIEACDRLGVPVTVYGAYSQVRHRTKTGGNVALATDFKARDRLMAKLCTKCLALHNPVSLTGGTAYTYHCAKRLGRECWMMED